MKCLSTRKTPEGFKRRRYEDAGVRWTTIEVPVAVWNGVVRHDRVPSRVASFQRALHRSSLRAQGRALLAQGWKPIAIAHRLGVATVTVERWRREAQ